jgi:phage gp29-like protein
MRTTNLASASAKLQHDLKNLRTHWEISQELWDDQARRDFEEQHLEPMCRAVDQAVRAIDELQVVMNRMIREVGPRD